GTDRMARTAQTSRLSFAVSLGCVLLALATSAWPRVASAQTSFPTIPLWAYPGAYHSDAAGDTVTPRARTISLRWMRDPAAEHRREFGGYRIYRVTGSADTARMVLIRRFSVQFSQS